jgi:hypothetical protein
MPRQHIFQGPIYICSNCELKTEHPALATSYCNNPMNKSTQPSNGMTPFEVQLLVSIARFIITTTPSNNPAVKDVEEAFSAFQRLS